MFFLIRCSARFFIDKKLNQCLYLPVLLALKTLPTLNEGILVHTTTGSFGLYGCFIEGFRTQTHLKYIVFVVYFWKGIFSLLNEKIKMRMKGKNENRKHIPTLNVSGE